MSLLKIEKLNKHYGTFKALNNLNLEVKENEIYGFIGRNGAGKTTTLNSIMQFIDYDNGVIYFNGKPLKKDKLEYKDFISFVPDVPAFPEYLKGKEILKITADFIGIDKSEQSELIANVIEKTNVEYPNKKVSQYSRGMKQRLAIACGLLKKPALLIMDEPTSALDPIGRKSLLDLIKSLKNEMTILYSTHILADAQSVCDRIGLIEKGELLLEGDIYEILNSKTTNKYVIESERIQEVYKLFSKHAKFVTNVKQFDNQVHFSLKESAKQRDIYALLATYEVSIDKLSKQSKSLEDVFMEVLKSEDVT